MKLNPGHKSVCAWAVVGAVTLAAHAQSPSQQLTPQEVRALLSGNTFTGESNTGNGFHVFYRADGAMYGLLFKGPWKGKRDDGTWKVTNERGHCRQWAQWGQAEEQCFRIYRDGNKLTFEQISEYKVLKGSGVMRTGNPENL